MTHILLLLCWLNLNGAHDFHTSVTNGKLNPKSGDLELSLKVFTDDLELAIKNNTDIDLKLLSDNPNAKTDSLIENYILSRFQIKKQSENLQVNYVGKEIEIDITFIYLNIKQIAVEKELSVRNTVFFDTFDDQSNIVNIKIQDKTYSVFLDASSPEKSFELK